MTEPTVTLSEAEYRRLVDERREAERELADRTGERDAYMKSYEEHRRTAAELRKALGDLVEAEQLEGIGYGDNLPAGSTDGPNAQRWLAALAVASALLDGAKRARVAE